MSLLFPLLISAALLVMLLITLSNLALFPRLGLTPRPSSNVQPNPAVAVLIPARNEAQRIGPTIQALLAQDYPNLTLFVLDDHSTDNTAAVVQQASQGDPRLHLLGGAALPAGWGGKNWACHQLAQAADQEILIFTDADVSWQPGAVSAVATSLEQLNADLLTVWPTQITVTWGERLVAPLMALAVWAYLPIWLVHHTPYPSAAAANGQCLVFRRAAYKRCGGHAAVHRQIVEDVQLARRVKAGGLRLRMAEAAGLIQTRMYQNWPEVRDGYAKNILAGHGNSLTFLLLSTCFHLAIFVSPWLWLVAAGIEQTKRGWLWPLGLVLVGVGIRALTAYATGQRLGDSWLLPLSTLLMSRIAWQAIWWRLRNGGPQWKGRVYAQT